MTFVENQISELEKHTRIGNENIGQFERKSFEKNFQSLKYPKHRTIISPQFSIKIS